jgi:VWFA-related protein
MTVLPVLHKIGALSLICVVSTGLGQQSPSSVPAPEVAQATGVTISSRTELVTVPVVVTDKKGKHLSGLKQSDFTIEEDGQKREIATFQEIVTSDSAKKPLSPPAFPLSNFASSDQEGRLVTILVVDLLNTPFMYQENAREQLLKFLNAHLNGSGPTSLTVITSRGLRLVHSFTTDPAILIEAMKRIESNTAWRDQAAPGQLSDLSSTNAFDQSLGENPSPTQLAHAEAAALRQIISEKADADYAYYRQRDATVITLSALEQLAQSSAGIPGRKSLLWITGGLPFVLSDPNSLTGIDTSLMSNYQRTWQALNDANISVYPIDAHGLVPRTVEMQSKQPTASRNNPGFQTPSRASRPNRPSFQIPTEQNSQDSLRNFAQATGGEACYNRNDLNECVAIAGQDSSQYYMLAYYLPADDRKPGWRKLRVHVAAAHREIRARNAFYVGEAKADDPHSIEQQFELAFSSPLDYTAVPLGLKFTGIAPAENGNRKLGFSVFLQPNGFATEDNWIKLNVHFVATDAKNKSILVFSKMFKAHLKPEGVKDLVENGFSYNGEITLSPGRYQLKLLVRDDLDGKFGSIESPFLVN